MGAAKNGRDYYVLIAPLFYYELLAHLFYHALIVYLFYYHVSLRLHLMWNLVIEKEIDKSTQNRMVRRRIQLNPSTNGSFFRRLLLLLMLLLLLKQQCHLTEGCCRAWYNGEWARHDHVPYVSGRSPDSFYDSEEEPLFIGGKSIFALCDGGRAPAFFFDSEEEPLFHWG